MYEDYRIEESPFRIEEGGLLVKVAETPEEIDRTLVLRFRVFNVEMGEGLKENEAKGRDVDRYDPFCDHLVVIDREKGDAVVGTYRILRQAVAVESIGFYSEGEFDLSNLKRQRDLVEVGRSCVHTDYRGGQVMRLLWGGVARYVLHHGVRYLFGCGSIHTSDVDEVNRVFSLVRRRYWAPEEFRVFPHAGNRVKELRGDIELSRGQEKEIFRAFPPVVRGYMLLGAGVCGEPAWDPEFGTTDLLVLLDTEKVTRRYSNHYSR